MSRLFHQEWGRSASGRAGAACVVSARLRQAVAERLLLGAAAAALGEQGVRLGRQLVRQPRVVLLQQLLLLLQPRPRQVGARALGKRFPDLRLDLAALLGEGDGAVEVRLRSGEGAP